MHHFRQCFTGSVAGLQECVRAATPAPDRFSKRSRPRVLLDVILGALGLALLLGGLRLVRTGASWHYVIAGAAMSIVGILIVRGPLSVAGLFPPVTASRS